MKVQIALIGVIVLAVLIGSTAFTVDEREQVVILQFQKPVRTITEAGLAFKFPYPFQNVVTFEDRLLEYDSAPTEIVTKDKKSLVIDNFARWRISDPLQFLKSVQNEKGAQSRLDDIIYSELRVELGKHDLHEIVSTSRVTIMKIVTENSNKKAAEYGIAINDVRIKTADLPKENEQPVYDRMRAERKRMANRYRSEGEEEALKITAETDKEKTILLAEAYKSAEETRGEGDAQALKIYADAYGKNPTFYQFYRTLEAYKTTLDTQTVVVLSPENDFLKYLSRRTNR